MPRNYYTTVVIGRARRTVRSRDQAPAVRRAGADRRSAASSCSTPRSAVIVRDGYDGLSVEAIAREAGVTRPVVYGAFDGARAAAGRAARPPAGAGARSSWPRRCPSDAADPTRAMPLGGRARWPSRSAPTPCTWRPILRRAARRRRTSYADGSTPTASWCAATCRAMLEGECCRTGRRRRARLAHALVASLEHFGRVLVEDPDRFDHRAAGRVRRRHLAAGAAGSRLSHRSARMRAWTPHCSWSRSASACWPAPRSPAGSTSPPPLLLIVVGVGGVVPAGRARGPPRARGGAARAAAAAALRRRDRDLAGRLQRQPPADPAAVGRPGGVHDRRRRAAGARAAARASAGRPRSRSARSSRRRTPSPRPRSAAGSACPAGSSRSSRASRCSTTRPRWSRCARRSPPVRSAAR